MAERSSKVYKIAAKGGAASCKEKKNTVIPGKNGHFKNHMEEDISSSSELSDAFGHSAHSFEEKRNQNTT